jgi:hypothetical protein
VEQKSPLINYAVKSPGERDLIALMTRVFNWIILVRTSTCDVDLD